MKKLVTLKDIARETGLTMASVSRALRDMPDIADETKQYVHDVAEIWDIIPMSLQHPCAQESPNLSV